MRCHRKAEPHWKPIGSIKTNTGSSIGEEPEGSIDLGSSGSIVCEPQSSIVEGSIGSIVWEPIGSNESDPRSSIVEEHNGFIGDLPSVSIGCSSIGSITEVKECNLLVNKQSYLIANLSSGVGRPTE